MKKAIWIILLMGLAIISGFFVGIRLYNAKDSSNELANNVENISNNNLINNVTNIEILTSASEEKISIDTEIVEEIYYTECDHLIRATKRDIKNLVNMTKEELARKYPDWEIKEFSSERVVLYKEEQDFCNEHYLVKDVDGYVTVYSMNNNDKIIEQAEVTEIETRYLTETDQEDLKEGIKVYTEQKLNKLIEDFE